MVNIVSEREKARWHLKATLNLLISLLDAHAFSPETATELDVDGDVVEEMERKGLIGSTKSPSVLWLTPFGRGIATASRMFYETHEWDKTEYPLTPEAIRWFKGTIDYSDQWANPIDREIVDYIKRINEFPFVFTTYSCGGHSIHHRPYVGIGFQTARLREKFAGLLPDVRDDCELTISTVDGCRNIDGKPCVVYEIHIGIKYILNKVAEDCQQVVQEWRKILFDAVIEAMNLMANKWDGTD